MTNIVTLGYEYFPDPTKGRPVFNGSIYVGEPDTDPTIPSNQKSISVIEEDGTVVPVSQPVNTGAGGVPLYNGSPVQLQVDGEYSLAVLNGSGSQVYYLASGFKNILSSEVLYNQGDAGAVDRTVESKLQESVSVKDFGAVGDGVTDDAVAIQAAIDANSGKTITLDGSYAISDTIYLTRGTRLLGVGNVDAWSGRTTGSKIITTGVGTARVWTDVNDPGYAQWYDLTDTAVTVMIVTEGDSTLENILVSTDDAWDIGIFNPACKRVSHINVDTYGDFAIAGYYIDATWGKNNTALNDLHANSYRTVNTDGAPNECYHENCWYLADSVGCMGKGTDRDPEDASNISELVWSEGGVSDLVFSSCRFGSDNGTVADKLKHGLYFDWGYARDINDRDSAYFQNHYFYGCSFRSGSHGRYSLLLDRSRYDNFVGMYGEISSGYTTSLITTTATSTPEEIVSPNPRAGSDGRSYKVKFDAATLALDIRTTEWTVGATVTSTSGGSFVIEGIGFDGVNHFFITGLVTGTVAISDTLTQAASQAVVEVAVCNDRTQNTNTVGQTSFSTASGTYSRVGGRNLQYPRAQIAGLVFAENEIKGLVDGVIDLEATGSVAQVSGSTYTTEGTTNEVRSTGTQLNLYANSGAANDRIRWLGVSLDSYNQADLGSSGRRWDTIYAINGTINTSDEREKTELLTLSEAENSCALELKHNIRKFRFTDSVKKKGDKARIHFGVGAQTIGDIFRAHGLNPDNYGLFCYDEWDEEYEEIDGKLVKTANAGNRYGIRYEELLCFIIGAA